MNNSIKAFEKFLLDGGIYSPDIYMASEPEDFSPTGVVNAAYINRFAEKREYDFKYAMIA